MNLHSKNLKHVCTPPGSCMGLMGWPLHSFHYYSCCFYNIIHTNLNNHFLVFLDLYYLQSWNLIILWMIVLFTFININLSLSIFIHTRLLKGHYTPWFLLFYSIIINGITLRNTCLIANCQSINDIISLSLGEKLLQTYALLIIKLLPKDIMSPSF